jgi:hypothetical protein
MESRELSEKSQVESLVLKNVGNFWIVKTDNITKRLVFLDNAKDVVINDGILIADERLFEIHKNGKGEYIFRKIEDLNPETYLTLRNIPPRKLGDCEDTTDKGKTDQCQILAQDERTYTDPVYEEIPVDNQAEQTRDRVCNDMTKGHERFDFGSTEVDNVINVVQSSTEGNNVLVIVCFRPINYI